MRKSKPDTAERKVDEKGCSPLCPTKINENHVLVRLFLALAINQHREADGQLRRPKTDHAGSACPRRYLGALPLGREWGDAESVEIEPDMNWADLEGFVRSELGAIVSWNLRLFQRLVEHSYSANP